MNSPLRFAVLALVASVAACSTSKSDKFDYRSRSEAAAPRLEFPPDITQLSRDDRHAAARTVVSANSYRTGIANAPVASTAVANVGEVRLERSGTQRWLVVNQPVDQLWEPVRNFWQENGFLLTTDQRNQGVLETDWAENKAKLPQDIVRNTVGKLSGASYTTGELNRFRTRLERTPDGGTEIHLSHRGMAEVVGTSGNDQAGWRPRSTDPELEAEFLQGLMVSLGQPQVPSKALVATAAPTLSRIETRDGRPVVQIDADFERVWRLVGLALDRTGFTVEDRDRHAGLYFVRYVTPNPDRKEPNLFTKLWNLYKPDAQEVPLKLRISIKSHGATSTVSVLDEAGASDTTENAQRIVKVIADELG